MAASACVHGDCCAIGKGWSRVVIRFGIQVGDGVLRGFRRVFFNLARSTSGKTCAEVALGEKRECWSCATQERRI